MCDLKPDTLKAEMADLRDTLRRQCELCDKLVDALTRVTDAVIEDKMRGEILDIIDDCEAQLDAYVFATWPELGELDKDS